MIALLLLAYSNEFFQRQMLALALVPIGVELGLGDTDLGLLLTLFGVTYGLLAIWMGGLADRVSRRGILSLGVAFAALMTALGAAATSFLTLAATRVGVGVGQVSTMPAGQALVADAFPPERRATVVGIVTMGAPLGILTALAVGGFGVEHFGWRASFVASGLLGLVLAAVLARFLHEPPRGFSEGRSGEVMETPRVGAVLRHLGAMPSFRHLMVAVTFASMGAMSQAQWTPGFLQRVHDVPLSRAGLVLAGVGVASALGSLLGGVLSDRMGTRDLRWYAWVPAIASLASAPLFAVAFLWPEPLGAVAWLVVPSFGSMFFGAPAAAIVQGLAPLSMRASAGAVLAATLTLVGMGLGPLATGAVSEALEARHGADSLRYALCGIGVVYALAGFEFLLAARSLRADLARAGFSLSASA